MWGIFPFGSSILAILVCLIPSRQQFEYGSDAPVSTEENLVAGRMAS
jgi:hypothetical protein